MLEIQFAIACFILVNIAWALAWQARGLSRSLIGKVARAIMAYSLAALADVTLVVFVSLIWPSASTAWVPIVAVALALPIVFADTKFSEQPSDPAA